jgi:predicted DCC family thiol-disulfide oxidoreductase YuxK
MDGPVLLYDGLCGLCDSTVQVALRGDRRGVVRFAPLQGPFAAGVMRRHPELAAVDSLVMVEEVDGRETVRVKSDAVFALAHHMGGPWRFWGVFRLVPRLVRDAVYDLVARSRYRIFGRRDACRIPTPEERARFLD